MYATIVTGYSRGIGRAITEELDKDENNWLIGISRNYCEDIYIDQHERDLSDFSHIHINEKFEDGTKINLILCAGTIGKSGGLLDSDLSDWQTTIATNLLGNLAVIKNYLPEMIRQKYGRIVFMAGGGAASNLPLLSGYSLSKVAVVREVENIAVELKDKIDDFSIIALAPGSVETDMLNEVRKAGVEVHRTIPVEETVSFVKKFIIMNSEKAKSLSGKFIHVRDDLESDYSDKWLLRRLE